ncbi:polysaccharide biosynthesis tyrosine autokinase [Clostridium sp. UBA4548]|uniref:polysaccharide biosynthesis tyrosine autokinase n=1 Tax=Clostridium sp. UBA4548 TaxID=1946361 RepID=UPI0025C2ED1E|nr:polysaccharide biosynthesis tyrosine autokinase [Clostridium sp. UBA4548]
MNLTTILQILRKHLPIMVVITLVVGIGSFFYGKSVSNTIYTAETSVTISESKPREEVTNSSNSIYIKNYDEFDLYTKHINTYVDLANSKVVMNNVIETLNLDMKIDELRTRVKVASEGNTGFLTIYATTSDAKLSQQIANQYAKSLKDVSKSIKNEDYVVLGAGAPVPTAIETVNTSFFGKVGVLLGLMISLAIVFLLEMRKDRAKLDSAIEQLSNVPVVGIVSNTDLDNSNPELKNSVQYDNLQTNLSFLLEENDSKVAVITSPIEDELTPSMIAKVGKAFANNGSKVLLIDSNFRTPSLQQEFNVSNSKGLADILLKDADINQCLSTTSLENLHLLSTGSTSMNSTSLLGSKKLRSLLDNLSREYDVILINSCPILTSQGTSALSEYCNTPILITASEKTKNSELKNSVDVLNKLNAKILGIVLNNSLK